MSATAIVLVVVLCVGVYAIAKQRGERKKAMEVMDHEETLDRIEAENTLDNQLAADAWDGLNTPTKPRPKRTRAKRTGPAK